MQKPVFTDAYKTTSFTMIQKVKKRDKRRDKKEELN